MPIERETRKRITEPRVPVSEEIAILGENNSFG